MDYILDGNQLSTNNPSKVKFLTMNEVFYPVTPPADDHSILIVNSDGTSAYERYPDVREYTDSGDIDPRDKLAYLNNVGDFALPNGENGDQMTIINEGLPIYDLFPSNSTLSGVSTNLIQIQRTIYLCGYAYNCANDKSGWFFSYDMDKRTFKTLVHDCYKLAGGVKQTSGASVIFRNVCDIGNSKILVVGNFSGVNGVLSENVIVYDYINDVFSPVLGLDAPNEAFGCVRIGDNVYITFAGHNANYASNSIIKYTISTNTLSSIQSAGSVRVCNGILLDPTNANRVIVLGGFTTAVDASATYNRILIYDTVADTYSNIIVGGDVGLNGGTRDLVRIDANSIAVLGSFTGNGTLTFNQVVNYNITSNTWTPYTNPTTGVQGNFDSTPLAIMTIGHKLVIGGPFTRGGGINCLALVEIDLLSGVWEHVQGATQSVTALAPNNALQGSYFVGGNFALVENVYVNSFVIHSASGWQQATDFPIQGFNARLNDCIEWGDYIYVGGDFGRYGANQNIRGLARYKKNSHSPLLIENVGFFNAGTRVLSLATETVNNYIWVAGVFNTVSGQTTTNLVAFDENGTIWHVVTGFNNTINSLAVGADGYLYIGGAFTAPHSRLCRLNLTTLVIDNAGGQLSADGTINRIRASRVDGAGEEYIYICGNFTELASTAGYLRIGRFRESTSLMDFMGDGLDGVTFDIIEKGGGDFYICGAFSGSISPVEVSRNIILYNVTTGAYAPVLNANATNLPSTVFSAYKFTQGGVDYLYLGTFSYDCLLRYRIDNGTFDVPHSIKSPALGNVGSNVVYAFYKSSSYLYIMGSFGNFDEFGTTHIVGLLEGQPNINTNVNGNFLDSANGQRYTDLVFDELYKSVDLVYSEAAEAWIVKYRTCTLTN